MNNMYCTKNAKALKQQDNKALFTTESIIGCVFKKVHFACLT